MSIEEELRNIILERYKTMKSFADAIDMKYTTLDSIFKRGIMNSNVQNIIKICGALGISVSELAQGRITPLNVNNREIELKDIITMSNNLVVDGRKLTETEKRMLVYYLGILRIQRGNFPDVKLPEMEGKEDGIA